MNTLEEQSENKTYNYSRISAKQDKYNFKFFPVLTSRFFPILFNPSYLNDIINSFAVFCATLVARVFCVYVVTITI